MGMIFNVELHFTYANGDKSFWIFPCSTFDVAMKVVNEIIDREKEGDICPEQCQELGSVNDDVELPIILTGYNDETMEIYICEDKIIDCDDDVKNFVDY